MGFFSRQSCGAAKKPAPCQHICSSPHSRNAFIHFVKAFRQECQNKNKPVWCLVIEAADKWNTMALHEKFCYIQAAHNSSYTYRSRNRRLNRVMKLVRKALEKENEINLEQLTKAVKQMQSWKRAELDDI